MALNGQNDRQTQQPQGGLFGGFLSFFQQLFGGGTTGGSGAGGGFNFFQGLLNLFGLGNFAQQASPEDISRKEAIREQQAELAAQGLYPSTGSMAQDGVAGSVMQHAYRLKDDPNYAQQYMHSALQNPNMSATDIMKLQATLNKLGYHAGDVDGRLDNDARGALQGYLRDHPAEKRAMTQATQEAVAPRTGITGWFAEKLDNLRSVRDHAFAPASTPGSVKGLLGIISQHESGQNYNAAYGHSNGIAGKDFTNMTVNEVMEWQRQYVREGSPSSAVGRYQIIGKTMAGLKRDMHLTGNEKFTPELQDRMAVRLLEWRGLNDFRSGRISADQFMHNVSQEWASMPKDRSGRGYYDGDGLNRAAAGVAAPVLAAIHAINAPAPVQVAAATPAAAQRGHAPSARANDDIDFGRTVTNVVKHGADAIGLTSLWNKASHAIFGNDDPAPTRLAAAHKPAAMRHG